MGGCGSGACECDQKAGKATESLETLEGWGGEGIGAEVTFVMER